MLFCGFGEIVINNLFVVINLFYIFVIMLKRREREIGIVFEFVVDMICDDVIVEEKRWYNIFIIKCFENFYYIFLYINIFEIKFLKLYCRI